MPPEEVRKHRDEPLAVLASRFWVSEEAVAFRLKNLAGEEAEKKRLLPLG
jgi:Zn-dependent peptidase ImmA (M78 family)